MLEKVVIKVDEEVLQQHIMCAESALLDDLLVHGVEMIIGTEERLSARDKEDILYITDSGQEYRALRQNGWYVLPYRHEKNQETDFTGAMYVLERVEEADYGTLDMAYRRLAGLPWEILTTGRCVIRETTVEDVEAFYQIYAEEAITEYMEDLFEDSAEEIAYTRDYIEKVYAFYGYGLWTVLEKESGQVIGRAGITWREGFGLPELGFVIQGGDPEGTGMGGPGYSIRGEFRQNGFDNDLKHTEGVLSMARSMHPDSAGSQFFIMHKTSPHLDGAYAAFGKVIEGMDVVNRIAETATDYEDRPLENQVMQTVTVDTFGVDYPEPEKI